MNDNFTTMIIIGFVLNKINKDISISRLKNEKYLGQTNHLLVLLNSSHLCRSEADQQCQCNEKRAFCRRVPCFIGLIKCWAKKAKLINPGLN